MASGEGLRANQIKTIGLPVRAGFWDAPLPNKEQYDDFEAQVYSTTAILYYYYTTSKIVLHNFKVIVKS